MVLASFLSKLKQSFVHLVYPPYCLHCETLISYPGPLLCEPCSNLLALIDPSERCPACFNFSERGDTGLCSHCVQAPRLFYRMAAAFDYIGPAASLIKKFKYANQPYLAKGIGASLIGQFNRLQWPLPDLIIPVPLSFTHWIERGYNQSALLAQVVGHYLKVPVWDVLRRKSGDYSQAGLSLQQRQVLEGKSFKLKKGVELYDKSVLIIDDVMTTGSTLQRCAEALLEGCPSSVYALTFCQALK